MGKFSSIPVYKAMIKSKYWKYLGFKRTMGKLIKGGYMLRKSGLREKGIKAYNFEYINNIKKL